MKDPLRVSPSKGNQGTTRGPHLSSTLIVLKTISVDANFLTTEQNSSVSFENGLVWTGPYALQSGAI